MTPDEEVRINKRQRRAEVLSWLLAVIVYRRDDRRV
jgi:hypothetical protein